MRLSGGESPFASAPATASETPSFASKRAAAETGNPPARSPMDTSHERVSGLSYRNLPNGGVTQRGQYILLSSTRGSVAAILSSLGDCEFLVAHSYSAEALSKSRGR